MLPLYSTIGGAFQVLGRHLLSEEYHNPQYSFVDFGYGTSKSSFAGNHRFAVRRPPDTAPALLPSRPDAAVLDDDAKMEELQQEMADDLGRDEVEIRLEMYYCHPTNPKGVNFLVKKMTWFHILYSRLLFWDGVRRAVKAADEERKRS